MISFITDKSQLLMNSEGYLRRADAWTVRERRDLVRWATGLEGVGGTNFWEGNNFDIGAMGAAGSILRGGFALGSETTLGGGSRG